MRCSFCDHELTLDMIRAESCGACRGGCRKLHCPYCGQENMVVPEFLDKLCKPDNDKDKKGPSA